MYYHHKQPEKDWVLKCRIEEVLEQHKDYGYRRVAQALHLNKKPVQRVMRLFGIKAYRRKGRKLYRKAKKTVIQYANILRRMYPSYPGHVWVSDFTYIRFQGQFVYLSTVMDLFTREIVGWAVMTHHRTPLVLQAVFSALLHRSRPAIFHSDNGSEYDSQVMVDALTAVGVQISRITPGCPWENGYQEGFYARFKTSLGDPSRFNSLGELVHAIYQELHRYNRSRIHSALAMSPLQFRHQFFTQKVSDFVSKKMGS